MCIDSLELSDHHFNIGEILHFLFAGLWKLTNFSEHGTTLNDKGHATTAHWMLHNGAEVQISSHLLKKNFTNYPRELAAPYLKISPPYDIQAHRNNFQFENEGTDDDDDDEEESIETSSAESSDADVDDLQPDSYGGMLHGF